MPKVKIENLFKTYRSRGGRVAALENVNLDTEQNEFITLVGPSGHPTRPFMAAGGAMAIEDAAILSRCLAEFDEPNDVYRWYEASVTPSAFQSRIAGCADQPTPIGFIATIPVWRRSVGPHRVRGVPTMMEPKPDDFPRSAQRCGHSSAFGCRKVDAATEQSARP